jgi:hypothetical protein
MDMAFGDDIDGNYKHLKTRKFQAFRSDPI